jgi:hypothetical protein
MPDDRRKRYIARVRDSEEYLARKREQNRSYYLKHKEHLKLASFVAYHFKKKTVE